MEKDPRFREEATLVIASKAKQSHAEKDCHFATLLAMTLERTLHPALVPSLKHQNMPKALCMIALPLLVRIPNFPYGSSI